MKKTKHPISHEEAQSLYRLLYKIFYEVERPWGYIRYVIDVVRDTNGIRRIVKEEIKRLKEWEKELS